MPPSASSDPLDLGGLSPDAIARDIADKQKKPLKEPTAAELAKEERLRSKEARLAGGKGAAKAAEPPPPPPEVDKGPLLDRVFAYRERFPWLKKRNNVSAKSTVDEIADELHYCELQLGSKQDTNLGGMLLHGTMVAVESIHRDVWNPLRLDLTGLGQVTKQNMDQFQPILDELMIKYGTGMYVGPEVRLCLSIGALMVTVHAANSGDPKIAHALQQMNATVNVPKGTSDL